MRANKVDLALHPVIGLVLQVLDAKKFPQTLGLECLDPFLRVIRQGPCFTAIAAVTARKNKGEDLERKKNWSDVGAKMRGSAPLFTLMVR